MIYCVVPQPLAEELYDRLVAYYEDDPNVKVIVDRREGNDRRSSSDGGEHKDKREIRDRRRRRAQCSFPPIEPAV